MFLEYITNLEEKIDSEQIYTSSFYIIVNIQKDKENITEITNAIKSLSSLDMEVELVNDRRQLIKIIYSSINKVGGLNL